MSTKLDLDIPRMGYFLVYKSEGSFFSKQIVKKQLKAGFTPKQASVSHVEVSGGGPNSINTSPPKSKLINITETHKGRYVYIMKYKDEAYDIHGRYKVAYFSATLNNVGYDILGALRFVFKWIKQNNRLFFCSEGALWSLQKQYANALKIEPKDAMPAHFMDETYFECIWKGVIS